MNKEQVLEWLLSLGKDWVDGFTVYEKVKDATSFTNKDSNMYSITKWRIDGFIEVIHKSSGKDYEDSIVKFKLTDKALKLLEE